MVVIVVFEEDNIDVRDKVMAITPNERKRLGINKSTLWYQQKHIREGRRIKIYRNVRNLVE